MSHDESVNAADLTSSVAQPRPARSKTPTWLLSTIIFALLAIAMGVNSAVRESDPYAVWIIAFPVLGLVLALWARGKDLTEAASKNLGSLAQMSTFAGIALASWSSAHTQGWSTYFLVVVLAIGAGVLWYFVKLLTLPGLVRAPRDQPPPLTDSLGTESLGSDSLGTDSLGTAGQRPGTER